MPKEIYLLKVGMTMTEGMVSEWYIADGQQVNKGEMLYALETEKVNMDVDAEFDGKVKHLVQVGEMMEPGDVVGFIFEDGEEIPSNLSAIPVKQNSAIGAVEPGSKPGSEPETQPVDTGVTVNKDNRVKSSPAARRLAKELDVDITTLTGTGPGGRIVEADVQAVAATVVRASPLAKRLAEQKGVNISSIKGSGPGGRIVEADIEAAAMKSSTSIAGETIAVKGMRKTIAQRMFASLHSTAQLTMDMEASMDDAVRLRESLIDEWQGEQIRPTYTDLVVKAVAKALKSHPLMNSQLGETEITLLSDIHVGIAVAVPDGLVVPVIRNADKLSVKEITVESSRLATLARNGTLGLDDYAGGTFTISALGMYGVDSFTPIINTPQAGILGVNRIFDGVAWDGDRPLKAKKMNLSLTWDHRVLDGAPAAEFLAEVCTLLANPYRLLV
ncbi:MAG: dihydrolipoamide acetyltransferase family protein [Gammaproteobacteria bacterium]|nr:dihydrolipoamide acetyltransferase family protein [Gammaproteobacteria bacterium]